MEFTNHELGPAIIFQHFPTAIRLDHYLIQRKEQITDDLRLGLMRQIAETIGFAHGKHVVHRSLSPRAILVVHPESGNPQTVIMNWQLGYRQAVSGGTVVTQQVTRHHPRGQAGRGDARRSSWPPRRCVDFDTLGEHHDIFSLGAVCYQLFTGQAPAESPLALAEKLRVHRGLRVSAVLNGAPESLDQLVQYSTDPDVSNRLDTADEFIELLDKVEDELTTPSNQLVGDPTHAKPGDILPGGYEVIRKLGTGSTATAMLVRKDDHEFVAKIAVDTDHNDRVRDEGEVLQKLDSPLIVRCHGILQFGDRTAILLDQAGEKTLGKRLGEEGRLSLDLLQRFGEDLLEAVVLLEREGIAHRDIKPDNIGVSAVGARTMPCTWCSSTSPCLAAAPRTSVPARPAISIRSCPCASRPAGTCRPSDSRRRSRSTRWPRASCPSGTTARPIRRWWSAKSRSTPSGSTPTSASSSPSSSAGRCAATPRSGSTTPSRCSKPGRRSSAPPRSP